MNVNSQQAAMGEGGAGNVNMDDSLEDDCMAEDLSMASQISQGDMSGSADYSHPGSDEIHDDVPHHMIARDVPQDMVARDLPHDMIPRGVSSPPLSEHVHDEPEDLRWEQHK